MVVFDGFFLNGRLQAIRRQPIGEYIEDYNLGFDMDEIEEIVCEARNIRNRIIHSMDDAKIFDNVRIGTQLRKIVIFVMLRELGLDM